MNGRTMIETCWTLHSQFRRREALISTVNLDADCKLSDVVYSRKQIEEAVRNEPIKKKYSKGFPVERGLGCRI